MCPNCKKEEFVVEFKTRCFRSPDLVCKNCRQVYLQPCYIEEWVFEGIANERMPDGDFKGAQIRDVPEPDLMHYAVKHPNDFGFKIQYWLEMRKDLQSHKKRLR